jgi:hypothetical protein
VVAVAEHLGLTEIATIDRQHLRVVRPRHTTALTLLPQWPASVRPGKRRRWHYRSATSVTRHWLTSNLLTSSGGVPPAVTRQPEVRVGSVVSRRRHCAARAAGLADGD